MFISRFMFLVNFLFLFQVSTSFRPWPRVKMFLLFIGSDNEFFSQWKCSCWNEKGSQKNPEHAKFKRLKTYIGPLHSVKLSPFVAYHQNFARFFKLSKSKKLKQFWAASPVATVQVKIGKCQASHIICDF